MKGLEFVNHLKYIENLDIEKMQAGLRFLRYCAGLYAEEVVHYLGVSRQYYTQLETGKRKLTKTMALAILYIFGRNRGYQRTRVNDNDTNYCNAFMWITQKNCVLDVDDNRKLSEFVANNRRHKVVSYDDLRNNLAKVLSNSKIAEHKWYDMVVEILTINMCNLLDRIDEKKQNE